MSLISIVIAVLVLCVAIWAVQTLTAAFAVPPQIRAVVLVLIVVLVVLWVVSILGGGSTVLRLR